MRKALLLLLMAAAGAAPRAAWGKAHYWVGKAATENASEAANWHTGTTPGTGDRVVFGSLSERDCRWDLDVALTSMTLTMAYKGTVRLGRSNLGLSQNVRVAGGVLDLEEGTLTVGRRVYLDHGGALQLSGGTLLLGPLGLLVDAGGTLLSTGGRPARVASAEEGKHYPFVVGVGAVRLANPAGTKVESSQGLVINSGATIEQADFVQVEKVEAGRAGLTLHAGRGKKLVLKGWRFDESVAKPLDGSLARGAEVRIEAETPQGKSELTRKPGQPLQTVVQERPAPAAAAAAPIDALVWKAAAGKASDPANWSQGRAPKEGDWVVFDAAGGDCDWDLSVSLGGWTQEEAFAGTVRLGGQALVVTGPVRVSGGALDLESSDLTVEGPISVIGKGTLELGSGALRPGNEGVRVGPGGSLHSTASEPAFVRAGPAGFSVTVDGGRLRLANRAGTVFQGSRGLRLEDAVLEKADDVRFEGSAAGATALTVVSRSPVTAKLTGWSFDGALAVNVDATGAAPGSRIVLAESAGERAGSSFARDPAGALDWESDKPFSVSGELRPKTFEVTPYVAAQFLMGQYFFGGEEGNLSGNASFLASSVIKHEGLKRWSFVPLLSVRYQGTKQVTDLVGGGTLFQELSESRLAVRAVYQPSTRWKIKPEVGYKWQFLKETRDEEWGKGLFDHERPNASVEAEYIYRDPFSVRAGYDYYQIRFPNYVSLESQAQAQPGEKLARELAGARVIDSTNHALYAGGSVEVPWRSFLEGTYTATFRSFPEQHVVTETGDLAGSTRRDTAQSLSLAWRVPREAGGWRTVAGLSAQFLRNDSNQNSYDAQRTKFLDGYYDSKAARGSIEVGVSKKLGERRTAQAKASAGLGQVRYPGRIVQDASGLYRSGAVSQTERVLSAAFSYPIAPHFLWSLQAGYGRQTSNQDFEKLYRYNFTTTNYLMGFSYEW